MQYDVDEFEILPEEKNKTPGERLTIFKCSKCKLPLSEAELSEIRSAFAPCMHYECFVLQHRKEHKSFFSKLLDKLMRS